MDYRAFKLINGLTGNAADGLFALLAKALPAVIALVVGLIFAVPWRGRRHERRSGALLGTTSAGLTLLISQPIAHTVERMRPYLAHPVDTHLLIARSQDFSFPSDHAGGAFALAFGIWLYDRLLGSVLLILGALLSFSRVYVGTHYPGDVVGGAMIGTTISTLLFVIPATRRFLEQVTGRVGSLWDRASTRLALPADTSA